MWYCNKQTWKIIKTNKWYSVFYSWVCKISLFILFVFLHLREFQFQGWLIPYSPFISCKNNKQNKKHDEHLHLCSKLTFSEDSYSDYRRWLFLFLPGKLKCVFPPTLLRTVCNYFVESNNNLREYRPHTDFWMPTFFNQPTDMPRFLSC